MIYLASPYSYNNGSVAFQSQIINARYKLVEFQTAVYLREKRPVLSPIVHNHELVLHYDLPGDFEYWQSINRAWISCCVDFHILDLPGWEKSRGVREETEFATRINLEIDHIKWEEFLSQIDLPNSPLADLVTLLENAEY